MHHLYGNPIVPFVPTSSLGYASVTPLSRRGVLLVHLPYTAWQLSISSPAADQDSDRWVQRRCGRRPYASFGRDLLSYYPCDSFPRHCLTKRADTVGEPPSTENCASHRPSVKVQESEESNAAIAVVSYGNRFANSIRAVFKTDDSAFLLVSLSE